MKFKSIILTTVSTLALFATVEGVHSLTANADTWHNGQPNAVVGKWVGNLQKDTDHSSGYAYYKAVIWTEKNTKNNGINPVYYLYNKNKKFIQSSSYTGGFWNAKYKKVGSSTYYLKSGYNSNIKSYPNSYKIIMHGSNHLSLWTNDGSRYKYKGYLTKVNKLPIKLSYFI